MDEAGVDGQSMYVGVRKRTDGSLDFSSAARMLSGEQISDPVVDRLRGKLIVDSNREIAYQRMAQEVAKMEREGKLGIWFAGLLNSFNARADGQSPGVTPEDLTTLKFVIGSDEVKALEQTFGGKFVRPFFRVNLAEYRRVYEKFTGKSGSNGCVINGGALEDNDITRGIGIIFAPELGPEIAHELHHTIDPNLHKRPKSDAVLEEYATYYRETYVPRVYLQKTTFTDENGVARQESSQRQVFETLPRIANTLKEDVYASNYGAAFGSKQEYGAKVDAIAGTIGELEKYMSKPDINRAIMNAKTHEELAHLLEVVRREKR